MRHRPDSRTILVNKANLIAKVKENKENHIKEYAEAVIAYKEQALKQLKENQRRINAGDRCSYKSYRAGGCN